MNCFWWCSSCAFTALGSVVDWFDQHCIVQILRTCWTKPASQLYHSDNYKEKKMTANYCYYLTFLECQQHAWCCEKWGIEYRESWMSLCCQVNRQLKHLGYRCKRGMTNLLNSGLFFFFSLFPPYSFSTFLGCLISHSSVVLNGGYILESSSKL